MKKSIICIILSVVLLAGCQSAAGSPVDSVNKFLDSVFYMTDSDAAYANLGMNSAETRELLIGITEYDLQAMFFPTEEEAESNGEDTEVSAEDGEEVAEEIVIDPSVSALASRIVEIMQGVVKYKTKMMTLSGTSATVKISVYPYDVNTFYTEYINQMMAIEYPEDVTELTEEQIAEYAMLEIEAYSKALEGVGASSTAYDLYVDLYKSENQWYINDVETVFYDLYYLFTGTYY